MQNFLMNLNYLLAQTAAEKKLTYLYVGLFLFLLMLLLVDSTASKKYISNNPLKKITWVLFIIVFIALILVYFLVYKKIA